MAQPTQQVQKGRDAVRSLLVGLVNMQTARETLRDLGGKSFIAYLDGVDPEGNPIYDISSDDVVAALVTAADAIEAVLDANGGAHRVALRKLL